MLFNWSAPEELEIAIPGSHNQYFVESPGELPSNKNPLVQYTWGVFLL
jgi:hypothetical protein